MKITIEAEIAPDISGDEPLKITIESDKIWLEKDMGYINLTHREFAEITQHIVNYNQAKETMK